MSNIPEEAGKAASSTIEALRGSPALLVLVLLQLAQLGAIYFLSQATQTRNQEREMTILNRCFPPGHDYSSRHGYQKEPDQ